MGKTLLHVKINQLILAAGGGAAGQNGSACTGSWILSRALAAALPAILLNHVRDCSSAAELQMSEWDTVGDCVHRKPSVVYCFFT